MKKTMDIVCLVIFIAVGIGLYIYMGNAIAAQVGEPKYMIEMTALESYRIWDAVNKLEEPWYVTDPGSLEVVPLKSNKSAKLRSLVVGYEYLKPLVEKLIEARQNGDLPSFTKTKEKIAQELRPVWRQAILDDRKRNPESASVKAWLAWMRNNVQGAMNRLYAYFFPAQQVKNKLVGQVDPETGEYVVTIVPQ